MQLKKIVGVLFLFLTIGCKQAIVHSIPEDEANRIVSILHEHGIDAFKVLQDPEKNLWNVSVSAGFEGKAWALLTKYKLPREKERRLKDIFGKSKLVSTPLEEKALFLEAIQGELAYTLEQADGVIDARVHIVMPEEKPGEEQTEPPKASVFVEYSGSSPPFTPDEVKKLVSNGLEGLKPQNVAVVFKQSPLVETGKAGRADIVKVGGLIIDRSSLTMLKIYGVVALGIIIGLSVMLYLTSKMNISLKLHIEELQNKLRIAEKKALEQKRAG